MQQWAAEKQHSFMHYAIFCPVAGIIFHMDWYRLKDETEAIQAGCEDCIESGDLCLIEWSEKFPDLLPPGTLHIYFEIINENERRLIIPVNQSTL